MIVSKEEILRMATKDVEMIFIIVGSLGYVGYKVSMCKLKNYSYSQCAIKFGITKELACYYWRKCKKEGFDKELIRIFSIPQSV